MTLLPMRYFVGIFLFSASLVAIAVFAAMTIAGLRRGYIYYEPNCPPIVFRDRPVAFIALCMFYLSAAGAFSVGAVRSVYVLLGMP